MPSRKSVLKGEVASHLKESPLRFQKAVILLIGRYDIFRNRPLVFKLLKKIDWETVESRRRENAYPGFGGASLDGSEEADDEELVLFHLCQEADKDQCFDDVFGLAGRPMKEVYGRFADGIVRGRPSIKKRDDVSGDESDDDDDADEDVNQDPDDMDSPFAKRLIKVNAAVDAMRKSPAANAKRVPDEVSLGPGARIRVLGLKSRPDLNSLEGIVVRRKDPEQPARETNADIRFVVKLKGGVGEFSLKGSNLLVVQGAPSKVTSAAATPGMSREDERENATAREAVVMLGEVLLDLINYPSPSKHLRKLIRETLTRRANLRIRVCMVSTAEQLDTHELLMIQFDAAFLVFYSKAQNYNRCPDALWIRGAVHFLRKHFSEFIKDISTCLAIKPKKWIDSSFRQAATGMLENARNQIAPRLGRWSLLSDDSVKPSSTGGETKNVVDSAGPGRRLGAATCTVSNQLFLFGGLETKSSDASILRAFSFLLAQVTGAQQSHQPPLGDFHVLDLVTKKWAKLDEGPPARGFGLLVHHPETSSLFLFSGRDTWQARGGSGKQVVDMWRYDLKARSWETRRGATHPRARNLSAHGIHNGQWFICDTKQTSTDERPQPVSVLRYDLASGVWGTPLEHSSSPSMASPATGRVQNGQLFVWSQAKDEKNTQALLWAVSLEGSSVGKWRCLTMVGPEQQPKLRFKGALAMNWVEGSCNSTRSPRRPTCLGAGLQTCTTRPPTRRAAGLRCCSGGTSTPSWKST